MNVEETIDQMVKEGIIKRENLTHKPREGIVIIKYTFWFNRTPISQRWDCEMWYEDKSHERIAKVSLDSKRLIVQYAHNMTKGKSI